MVSREPSLVLPLACRIPGVQAKGPQHKISMPTEKETFGEVRFWIEFHLPGEGPLAQFTRDPKLRSLRFSPERVRREVESLSRSYSTSNSTSNSTSDFSVNSTGIYDTIGSRINQLDLHVMSNCSVDRAEMVVSNCMESEAEDFSVSNPILEQGSVTNHLLTVIV